MDDDIQILIADDHPLMRKGLRLSIDEDPGMKVVGEASDGEMALAMIAKLHPQIALLDIEMPKLEGWVLHVKLSSARSKPRLSFLPSTPVRDTPLRFRFQFRNPPRL